MEELARKIAVAEERHADAVERVTKATKEEVEHKCATHTEDKAKVEEKKHKAEEKEHKAEEKKNKGKHPEERPTKNIQSDEKSQKAADEEKNHKDASQEN